MAEAQRNLIYIRGEQSPELPLRVLNLIAVLDFSLERASIECCADECRIAVVVAQNSFGKVPILLEKLRAMVLVWDAVDCPEVSESLHGSDRVA